jgi:uncharacterized protein (DUF1330 family)
MLISKSKVYELALSSVKEKCVNDFLEKYIPNVFPIVAEYGGKFLINGIIQSSQENKFPAKSFAILEWPSIGSFTSIGRDERMFPLLKVRNQYLEFILEGCFYNISENIDFLIPEDRTMSLLLSDRSVLDEQTIRFQWINDNQNRKLSLNLYFSNNVSQKYDKKEDIEKYVIQIQ